MYNDDYSTTEESSTGGFVAGLLCGAAIGAALGMAFAPKSGAEIRRQLADSTSKLKYQASRSYERASEGVNTLASRGRDAVSRGRDAFNRTRENATGETPTGAMTPPYQTDAYSGPNV